MITLLAVLKAKPGQTDALRQALNFYLPPKADNRGPY